MSLKLTQIKFFVIILILFNLFSCKRNSQIKTTVFNYYNNSELLNFNIFYKAIIKDDTVSLYKGNDRILHLSFFVNKNGIFIKDKEKKIQLYSFNQKIFFRSDNDLLHFFPHKVNLLRKKYYLTKDNEKYLIYAFVENKGNDVFYSYYMEDEGFICIYRSSNGDYDDKYLYSNSIKAKKVAKLFLSDSLFFAKLDIERRLKKLTLHPILIPHFAKNK